MTDRADVVAGKLTPERLAEIRRLWEEDEAGFRVLRAANLNDAEAQRLIEMHDEIRLLLAYAEEARLESQLRLYRLQDIALDVAKLWVAVQDGIYGSRSIVGDATLRMKAALDDVDVELPLDSIRARGEKGS